MRKPLVAGNWKMHGSLASSQQLLDDILAADLTQLVCDLAVFPPFPYLPAVAERLQNSPVRWGAQNVSAEAAGAFTGEVAASMLNDFACHYALAGHSERRALYGDTNEVVAQKFAQIQAQAMTPILCVGETLAERDAGQTLTIIKAQLDAVLSLPAGVSQLENAVVAYEPVWAIGTGKTATPEMAQEVHSSLRNHIALQDAGVAERLVILYGGSVKGSNAAGLFAMADIDGALVGGASLKADEFLQIATSAKETLCSKSY